MLFNQAENLRGTDISLLVAVPYIAEYYKGNTGSIGFSSK
jgi:hypothetical protein